MRFALRPLTLLALPRMATVLTDQPLSVAMPVQEIPPQPVFDQRYVFDKLGRSVVAHNHGLHKYPAKFVPQIPRWGLTHRPLSPKSVVLDPFAGSGTTVLEAALHGHAGIGVDINPLARYITQAKTLILRDCADSKAIASTLARDARGQVSSIQAQLVPGEPSLGLHHTWSNWFGANLDPREG